MKISLYPYQLKFKFPFRIAHGVRTHTDVVYVKLEHGEYTAWGEATLPPYLPETQSSVTEFINGFAKSLAYSNNVNDWIEALDEVQTNLSAKAALDMALWSLRAQQAGKTIDQLLGFTPEQLPENTYTIGVCGEEEMRLKIDEALAEGFEIFKLKLNGGNDEEVVRNFKSYTDKPFAVDVNQGWANAEVARKKAAWLAAEGCLLLEQPLPKNDLNGMGLLKAYGALPLFADESCQRLTDLDKISEGFNGVNIKLMKCGGITEAFKMIERARELEMKILIGCMSESSVGCTAAAQLAALADYADLDGPYLIANDPFTGMKVKNGRIELNALQQVQQFFLIY